MKIKYEFADGTVSEVEVEESIGAVIVEDRRLEDNLARKERYHCHSLGAVEFEGMKTWFITGSSSGIGQGIARAVLEKGDNAVIMARDIQKLEEIVQQYPDHALAVQLETACFHGQSPFLIRYL